MYLLNIWPIAGLHQFYQFSLFCIQLSSGVPKGDLAPCYKVHSTFKKKKKKKRAVHGAALGLCLIPRISNYCLTIRMGYLLLFKLLEFMSSLLGLGRWIHVHQNTIMVRVGCWNVSHFGSWEHLSPLQCYNYPV